MDFCGIVIVGKKGKEEEIRLQHGITGRCCVQVITHINWISPHLKARPRSLMTAGYCHPQLWSWQRTEDGPRPFN